MSASAIHARSSPLSAGAVAGGGVGGAAGRVLVLVPVLWALNLLDLLFTMLAVATGEFVEANPLARPLGPAGMVALKLAVLLFFTAVFVALRRRRSAEWGCYLLLTVYGALAVVWLTQYPFLLDRYHFRLLLAGG